MDQAKKELLLNLCVTSFILSAFYGGVAVYMDHSVASDTSYISGPGDAAVFVLIFLLAYALHVLISFAGYATAAISGPSLPLRLIAFNGPGLLLIGITAFAVKSAALLLLVITLIIFSIIMVINTTRSA